MKKKYCVILLLVVLILSIMPLYSHVGVYSGLVNSPRNPSIHLEAYSTSENANSLTWRSRWQTEPQLVENGSTIVGDHIIIESTWDSPTDSSRISFNSGFNETRTGTVPGPHYPDWPEPMSQGYCWETFEEVYARAEVRVELNFSQNGDPAFDVYSWDDYNLDNEVDPGEVGTSALLTMDAGGVGAAESGSYISSSEGAIAIRFFCWYYAFSLNMTFELRVETNLSINVDNDPGSPSQIVFDTYNLMGNATVNITLFSWNATNTLTVEFRDVTICNYFQPLISDIVAESVITDVWNISWSCFDKNENDTNYFSFWISSDSGTSYQLLATNLAQSHFVWDSTGYLMLDYLVRIRAFSLDFTFGNYCSTASPPGSYWPGDFNDAEIPLGAGDVHTGIPGFFSITIDEHPDIFYEEGMTGNVIVWVPTVHYPIPYFVVYEVRCNHSRWTSGRFYPSSDLVIEVNVDGLEIGTYEFKIIMDWCKSQSVIVTVLNNNDPDSPWAQLIRYGAIGVSIGSSIIITIVIVMTIRLRRNYDSTIPG